MHRVTFFVKSNLKCRGIKCKFVRSQSTNVPKESHETERGEPSEADSSFQKIKISTRVQEKLPPREPLVKNFFIGKVDKELFPFPEVIPREDLTKLHEDIRVLREKFETLDINKIVSTQCIGKDVRDGLQHWGLYGHNIPQKYGGSGYFESETLMAAEPAVELPDIANILSAHSVVADILEKFGDDYQKDHILPKLASGSVVATEAIYERTTPGDDLFITKAEYDSVDKYWVLNGEKTFVLNGRTAGMYMVLAQTSQLNTNAEIASGISVFLVDSTSSGVKPDKPLFTLGCRASEYSTVRFENVQVPESFVLGPVNGGNDIAQYLLQSSRLRMSLLNLGLVKDAIKIMTEHSTKEKQGGIFPREMEIVGRRLSDLVCKAYALESMIYFTAGLIDEFDKQDVVVEVAVTKLYSLSTLWAAASAPLDFMGPQSLLSGCATEAILRNAAQLYTQVESKDSLTLCTGLLGLQHAGMNTHETIKKERNPLFYPGYVLSKIMNQESNDNPKLKWKLNEDLHPTLDVPSKLLEFSIARLQMATEALLVRYGTEVIDKHTDIKRITEMATLIFAMFTSLSRASRSYCIGLKLSDYEILLASSVCQHAHDRVKTLAAEIINGPFVNNDRNHMKIAKQIFKSRGYFSVHPTTYNY